MHNDSDIKIAGNFPSKEIKKNNLAHLSQVNSEIIKRGTAIGLTIAEEYIKAIEEQGPGAGEGTEDMLLQRQILLSFSALSGFEEFIKDSDCATAAKTAFIDYLKKTNPEFYKGATDNGALSFYYLAYRRKSEVERRVGQTFAMLCSHDGDPVYQELGEALYCWFTSKVKKAEEKL